MVMIWQQLQIQPGIICLTGSGGKTTMAHCLAEQLPGSVVFCTSTKIFPSAAMPVICEADPAKLQETLACHRAVCIGVPANEGKLSAPNLPFEVLRTLADYVLVEADGSKCLPLKAHMEYEPVLPGNFERHIRLVGASCFGRPIAEAVHRAELFAQRAGVSVDDPVTAEMIAKVLQTEGTFDTLVINQVTAERQMEEARRIAAYFDVPAFAGEIRSGVLERLR